MVTVRRISLKVAVSWASRPEPGSSRSSSRGSVHSARPSSTIRPWPVDSSPAIRSASRHRSRRSMTSWTRRWRSRRPRPRTPPRCDDSHDATRLSCTVIRVNNARRWNVRAIPARPRRCGRPARDVLALEEHPPVGGLLQAGEDVEHRRLARAVRPDQADDLARGHVERHLVERAQASEADRDPVRGEHGVAPRPRSARPPSRRPGPRRCYRTWLVATFGALAGAPPAPSPGDLGRRGSGRSTPST